MRYIARMVADGIVCRAVRRMIQAGMVVAANGRSYRSTGQDRTGIRSRPIIVPEWGGRSYKGEQPAWKRSNLTRN